MYWKQLLLEKFERYLTFVTSHNQISKLELIESIELKFRCKLFISFKTIDYFAVLRTLKLGF